MPVTAQNITTKRDIVKELQYVTEGDSVSNPALFGVTPTSSTFTVVGNNTEITINPDVQHFDQMVLGTEDIIAGVKTVSLYSFTIKYNPIDTALFRYAWNASGGATTCPDSSLSFTYSYKINGTEYYQHMRGCRATSATMSLNRGVWECSITFVCKDITVPATTTSDGGTPVYTSSETSSNAITHSDGGGSPFTWNSINFGERSFSTTVNRGMAMMDVNGESDIVYCKAVSRDITFTTDVFVGKASSETSLYTDFENKTSRSASYKFTSSPLKTFTFSNCVISDYGYTHSAGSADSLIESITVRAESVTDIA